MSLRVRCIGIAIVVTVLAIAGLGCAAKRPILFAASDFGSHKVFERETAFLLMQPIDITQTLQDYVAAFEGDPRAGVSFTENSLRAYLTGVEPIRGARARSRLPRGFSFRLIDIAAQVSSDSINATVTTEQDEYGITQAHIDTTALAHLLTRGHVEYLILICRPNVNRGSSVSQPFLLTLPIPPPSTGVFGGGEDKFASLDAQVMVWDAGSQEVIWNGFVQGKHPISMNLTKNTVQGVASEFAQDLYYALR